jgi:hypothetical protein
VNIKLRENFEEFPRFSPWGLNPFKIHRKSKFESIPKIYSTNFLGIWSWANWESCLEYSYLASCKVWVFLDERKTFILHLKLELFLENSQTGWAHLSVPHSDQVSTRPCTAAFRPWPTPFHHRHRISAAYKNACGQAELPLFHFRFLSPLSSARCNALLHCYHLCFTITDHTHTFLSPLSSALCNPLRLTLIVSPSRRLHHRQRLCSSPLLPPWAGHHQT